MFFATRDKWVDNIDETKRLIEDGNENKSDYCIAALHGDASLHKKGIE